jgi:putative FmdB family regulatory protein
MPLYDFWCKDCMKTYEVILPLAKSDEKVKCPHCKKKLKRIIAPVYFTIKQ